MDKLLKQIFTLSTSQLFRSSYFYLKVMKSCLKVAVL